MPKLDTPINVDFPKFLDWWTGELAFMVPRPVRELLGAAPDYLVLVKDDTGLAVSHLYREGERPLGRFGTEESVGGLRERIFEQHPKLAEAKVALRLTSGQALRKIIKLPLAAEENLRQVLTFEMDRLTPFKSDQVYFGARIKSRSSATRQIQVEMILTPRARLDALLEDLAAAGFRPEVVDMAGDSPPGAVNLLPDKYRVPRSRWPRLLQLGLSTLILLLAGALAILPILSERSRVEALEEQVRKTGKIAKEVEALRQDTENLQRETEFLQEKKRAEPVLVDMLDELSRVIPNNTWLNGLQYKDRRIVIQGQSPSASTLIELIEASRHFKNTSFVSPVTKDTGSGLERFQIASDVINGRFSESPDPEAPSPDQPHPPQ